MESAMDPVHAPTTTSQPIVDDEKHQDIATANDKDASTIAHDSTTGSRHRSIKEVLFTREGWLGDYDYGFLCMPTLPGGGSKKQRSPPFFGLNVKMPLVSCPQTK